MTASESEAVTAQESGGIAIEPEDLALDTQVAIQDVHSRHDGLTLPILRGSGDGKPEVERSEILRARKSMRELELLLREIERSDQIRVVE